MESPEDVTVASSSTGECPCPSTAGPTATTKRKRTKRLRAPPSASSTSSTDNSSSAVTEEEEDMAHCLILLAQGHRDSPSPPPPPLAEEKFVSRKFTEAVTTEGGGKAGFYVYECMTCNKCFPSFQALGGHRASHKRPKITTAAADRAEKVNVGAPADTTGDAVTIASLPKPEAGKAARVHECSICGAEFSSGQALGGHMRRHRPILPAAGAAEANDNSNKESRSDMLMSLDLNLPAPCEDVSPPPPHYALPPLVFSTTAATATMALVDCHY